MNAVAAQGETLLLSPTLASASHHLLQLQWRRLQKHVARVKDSHTREEADSPEAVESLHQIRVVLRRIGTWVQVFQGSLKLPKPFQLKRIQKLGSALGKQRDLDVLLEILEEPCWKEIPAAQEAELEQLKAKLCRRRTKAQEHSRRLLKSSAFLEFQAAGEQWLAQPRYTAQAQLPLQESLPHLLTPLLAQWLLQPGWRISSLPQEGSEVKQLHDLRKASKRLRYQVEFFVDFYDSRVRRWLETLKTLQAQLGRFNDLQVLQAYLHPESDLQPVLQAQQALALQDWPLLRHQYLNPEQQRQLYQMLLTPVPRENIS